ncbi:phosphate signaling complex protein PhoU [Ammoniphilus sp. CFH 90114]|uniref:phosphate signaling complex protein PhoU n=1 Tax=Ammoniphilus sp. CFH 90114 TaxID=2493665 RepID=UPI00100F6BD4|nr:phosphate signaling complex protein PhoU [Ammoniphilus sp. CFH 90114]RXT04059.1 phosphate signaling complex protein PhoU [Ammoniphilus sp. CFH 90114]
MAGRHTFQQDLDTLHNKLLTMSSLVEESIHLSVKSLAERDTGLAEKVIQDDDKINQLYLEIEKDCFRLIALQQPMASDLRRIATVLKVVTDLERMADNAVTISKATLRLKNETYIKQLIDIPKMAELTKAMVRDALNAYINEDTELCYQIGENDHAVDALYKQIYNELVDMMQKRPETVFQATQFLFVAHSLERIGDHATNLGEWVIYMVTGKLEELND